MRLFHLPTASSNKPDLDIDGDVLPLLDGLEIRLPALVSRASVVTINNMKRLAGTPSPLDELAKTFVSTFSMMKRRKKEEAAVKECLTKILDLVLKDWKKTGIQVYTFTGGKSWADMISFRDMPGVLLLITSVTQGVPQFLFLSFARKRACMRCGMG